MCAEEEGAETEDTTTRIRGRRGEDEKDHSVKDRTGRKRTGVRERKKFRIGTGLRVTDSTGRRKTGVRERKEKRKA